MTTIFIDGKPQEVQDGQNLLQACLSLGFDLPYFCWHPALHAVGACRQCAVKQFKDEHDTRGRIVMACMTPAANGIRISIDDPEARAFRKSVIEWLMVNHPHDCPVCDEGGSCHLQDMTVMAGHAYRRYRFKKRTYRNQYLGPFLNHEMNRCIQCYRCVRFYRDYAGGRDLDVLGSRDRVYFGRHADGVLENEFSGNLAEICPTGVFTDKTLKKHYTRKWDLQWAPSVCPHCGVGCNVSPGERYGSLRCVVNRFHRDINGYVICDRGRYGYEHANSANRIRRPLLRKDRDGAAEPVTKDAALETMMLWLSEPGTAIGIGSSRASLESNFALRALVGSERFFAGMADTELHLAETAIDILQRGPAPTPSVAEVEACDAVVVLGEDLTNTAPRLALAVRQAVRQQSLEKAARFKIPYWDAAAVAHCCQNEKGPLLVATTARDRLDDAATWTYRAAPQDIARLGFAVANAVHAGAPASSDMSKADMDLVSEIARALVGAKKPAVLSGVSCGSEDVLRAAANLAWALRAEGKDAHLCFAVPECNSMGAALMGGGSLSDALEAVESGSARTVIVLENDLTGRMNLDEVDRLFNLAQRVVAIDSIESATTARADLVLPAAAFGEGSGTVVNNEGRAQRFFRSFVAEDDIQDSWRWLRDAMTATGRAEAKHWGTLDDVIAAMSEALPVLACIAEAAPSSSFRAEGQKVPRQPHRYSGRTAMRAHLDVSEPKPPEDPDSALVFSMEGYGGAAPSALQPFFWSPGWNSPSALNKYQGEVGAELRGGSSGVRLLGPSVGQASRLSQEEIPKAFAKRSGEFLLVPLFHIFGSEELSALAPAIAERAPAPYVAMNPKDAEALGLTAGDAAEITTESPGAKPFRLPVRAMPELPEGVAGVPAGLPGVEWIELPRWAECSKAK